MIRRFQIEDIIGQDASGVVFRALDMETGRIVALRRFFPFGADGGGLHDDEQTAYNIALDRLAGLRHPALRSVVCGGCDPVDGMPFIATEWIEGKVLDGTLEQQALAAESAVELLTQALEVCELLSHVLAEEAVWVETDLRTIVVGSDESGRGFTFWISPLKWLGGHEHARGLESIIALTEEVMGWQGRMVNDQAGRGLGAWLKWLRGVSATTSLREVRENLAAAVGVNPPPPVRQLVSTASPIPAVQKRPAVSKTQLLLAMGLALVSLGLGGWLLTRQRGDPPPALSAKKAPQKLTIAQVNERAAVLSRQAAEGRQAAESDLATQQAALAQQGGVFSPTQGALLLTNKNQTVTLEGTIGKIAASKKGKTLYLYFSKEPDSHALRGAIVVKSKESNLSKASLAPYVGKKVRITGKVLVRKVSGKEHPEIEIKKRTDIKVIEQTPAGSHQ